MRHISLLAKLDVSHAILNRLFCKLVVVAVAAVAVVELHRRAHSLVCQTAHLAKRQPVQCCFGACPSTFEIHFSQSLAIEAHISAIGQESFE